jgi:hypothetical protein
VGDPGEFGGEGNSTQGRILRSAAYIGRTYFNRTEAIPDRRPGHHSRQVPRPRSEWIAIDCPAIVTDATFQAAAKASADNSKWSPRRAEPGAWRRRRVWPAAGQKPQVRAQRAARRTGQARPLIANRSACGRAGQ